jgi:hypothetical protein
LANVVFSWSKLSLTVASNENVVGVQSERYLNSALRTVTLSGANIRPCVVIVMPL